MAGFQNLGEDLTSSRFVSDVDLIERYVGDTLWTSGKNNYGQLGDNTTTSKSSPVQTIASGTNWKQVSAGYTMSAIKTDGSLWLWGSNYNGRLGDNTTTSKSSPVQTIAGGTDWKQVSAGYDHITAIKTDGSLWLWGSNGAGRLGDNTTSSRSSPVQTICSGTNWKQVSGGYYFTSAIKTDGTLWLWGYNDQGQLGNGIDVISKSSPVQTICSGTNWKQVSCGLQHTAAIKTDGTLWLWGSNYRGALGDNTTTSKSSPVQTIAGGTNWKQVSAGGYFSTAIKTDGTLWTWGRNNYGQLCNNTTTHMSSPIQTIVSGTNWKQVSARAQRIIAVTNGT